MTETTRYFWLATFQWSTGGGFATSSLSATFEADRPVTRSETYKGIRDYATENRVPANATVLFLTIEPDVISASGAVVTTTTTPDPITAT